MTYRDMLDRALLEVIASRIRIGQLAVTLPDGARHRFDGMLPGPSAEVRLHDTRLLRRIATVGAIGLADGYIEGDFDTPDLTTLIELGALNVELTGAKRPEIVDRVLRAIWRRLGNHSAPRGPIEDIVHHYDLDNEFFSLWLDPTMTYSSGVFVNEEMTLEQAQIEKYRRLAEMTGIGSGDSVLEIGCGWGGFAIYAAEQLGCHVTALTVSREQFDRVDKLVADRGLADRIEARLEDFRDVRGRFDRVVSIEMIESIPRRVWAPYFRRLTELTRPGGADRSAGDHRRGPALARIRRQPRFRSSVRLPRWAGPSTGDPAATRRSSRAWMGRRAHLRQLIRDDAPRVEGESRLKFEPHRSAGVRSVVPADVAVLPFLLRGWVPIGTGRRSPGRPRTLTDEMTL